MTWFSKPLKVICEHCKETIEYKKGDMIQEKLHNTYFITCPCCQKPIPVPTKEE